MPDIVSGVIFAVIGSGILLVGYLVRYHQRTELIAGVESGHVDDEQRMARFMGAVILLMGAITLVVAGLVYLQGPSDAILVGYALLMLPLAIGGLKIARQF